VVDRATVPTYPVKPNKPRVILLWTLAGALLGLGLVALRNLLSEVVRSPDQLEQVTQLPVLSVLPSVMSMRRKESPVHLTLNQTRAPYSEGIRSIRASIYLNDVDRKMKRLLITSALPREGKSSIASSFAVTMAQMENVVLLEADLRAPSLRKIFGIPKDRPGVVELLTGQAKFDEAMYHHQASGVRVLPVAQMPANPAEVVSSAAFAKLLDQLTAKFDRVIVDSPPCQAAADAQILSHRVDAVLLVIHAGSTGMRAIQLAVKQLRAARAPLLGHVLNQVDARSAYGYDHQYYHYGTYGQP